MADVDEDLLDELVTESKEHLEAIEPELMALEAHPDVVDPEAVNRIFRAVHSMKGGFGFFSMTHITELAHSMENIMGLIRDGKLSVRAEIVDVLLAGADKLRVLIDDVHASETIPIDEELARLSEILPSERPDSLKSDEKSGEAAAHSRNQGTPEFIEAMSLLQSADFDELPAELAERLGELLRTICEQVTAEGKAGAEDVLADYLAIVKVTDLD